MAIYHIYIPSLYVNLVRLKRKRMKKRGRKVGEKYEFSTIWLMKANEGEEIWSGWFSTWDSTNFNPPNRREKRGWKMWKNAITILPFKPCHFLFLSRHFSTTKYKLYINFQFFMNFTHRDKLVLHRTLNLDSANGLLSLY